MHRCTHIWLLARVPLHPDIPGHSRLYNHIATFIARLNLIQLVQIVPHFLERGEELLHPGPGLLAAVILSIVLVVKCHIGTVVAKSSTSVEVLSVDADGVVADEALGAGFRSRIEPFGVRVDFGDDAGHSRLL